MFTAGTSGGVARGRHRFASARGGGTWWRPGDSRRRALAVAAAALVPLGVITAQAQAQAPTVGNGFVVTAGDIGFILKQIKIAELHASTQTASNPCGTLVAQPGDGIPDTYQIPDILTSYGLRTVDGSCNNLKHSTTAAPGQQAGPLAGNPNSDRFGSADVVFPRLTDPVFKDAEPITPAFPVGPPGPTSYKQKNPGNVVIDSMPRVISNLIDDQTSTNPAAVAASGHPQRSQNPNPSAVPCTTDPEPTAVPPVDGVPDGCTPSHKTLFIPNITTDVGLSPPFNSLFTFFGQFFDHGVDQTVKSGGTVFVPLRADDPLRTLGPDGKAGTGDEVPASQAFMVLTRSQNQPGPDGVLGTADDIQDSTNTDSPWVDQSQTYTSHASHQVFLRQYANNAAGRPESTGKFLDGLPAGQTYQGSPEGAGGESTWASVKQQGRALLGLDLRDKDVTNIPMLATDPYGEFVPGPARGLPQYVTKGPDGKPGTADDVLVEGNTASPVAVPADVVYFDTPFLTDIAHNADPSPQDTDHNPATPPVAPTPDADNVPNPDFTQTPPGQYDDEGLNAHFACGDGRCNENIALSSVHQIFHHEHNRLVDDIRNTLHQAGNEALLTDFENVTGTVDDPKPFALGDRYFQAARFVTEMEYQHLVFEEFARKVQPAVRPFHVYSPDINPAITQEFAAAVYRFGHSMLDDTVARQDELPDGSKRDNSLTLLNAFLNPAEYFNRNDPANPTPYTAEQAAGAIIMGSSDQVGNEIDEFVTEVLRNNLLGLPLDLPTLNMARARDVGITSLNGVRRDLFAQTNDGALTPYSSWADFGQHLKHPESLINFVAAYGTHPTVRDSGPDGIAGNADDVTTIVGKRNAARALVDPLPTDPVIADRNDFIFGIGAYADDANGITTTGLDDVDLWVGGLAELTNLNGGMLGSTFNYVFQSQLEKLQDGDRLYYLARTPGINLRTQLEGNSFAELIQRNTVGTHTLKADAFGTADCKFELSHLQPAPGAFNPVVADDPTSPCDESKLLQRKPDGTIQYKALNTVDPPGINGQSVYNGTPGADRVFGGVDNDTIWGGDGNDVIEGNNGDDIVLGGNGDDIITDLNGADVPKGGPGHDAIDAGPGDDIPMGNEGNDFINAGTGDNETFAGPGNDFVIAGAGADAVQGDSGDDWIEGGTGQDLLQGDHGAPFFDDPGEPAPGNDIFIGQPGENDYDAEGGDDLMSQNAAIDRNAGAGGFDWAFHQYDTVAAADDDMMINNNLGGLPIQVVINRDRWQETEADSGGPQVLNDVFKGTDGAVGTPKFTGGGGFTGCDAVDAAGLARIKGFDQVLPAIGTWTTDASTVIGLSAAGRCPLVGKVWGDGDVLLGGPGSDTFTGRSGDDVIDGDKFLQVAITVHPGLDGSGPELGRTDLMENKAISGDFGPGTAGMTLQQAVFAGKVDPGQLVAVREIVTPTVPAADCGVAAPVNCDKAVFAGPQSQYTITPDADGTITVTDTTTVAAAPGAPSKGDGSDRLRNIEQLQFGDGTLAVAAPAAPTGVTAVAGLGSATVTFTPGAGAPATGFIVTATPVGGGATVTATGTAGPITVSGLTNGTAFTFTVTATNGFGSGPASAPSAPVTPAAAPGAPAGVTATLPATAPVGGGTAVVNWTAPASNGGSPITRYTVRAIGPAGAAIPAPVVVNAPATTATVSGLTNGRAYTFTVQATNAIGNGPVSAASAAVTPVAPTAPARLAAPTTVRPLNAPFAATAPVVVNWVPGANGGSAITGFRIEGLNAGGVVISTTPAAANATSVTVSGLTPGNPVRFRVTATNAIGNSPVSPLSAAVTPATVPAPPGTVAAVNGAANVAITATVAWTAAANTGGAAITGYQVIATNQGTGAQVRSAVLGAGARTLNMALPAPTGQIYRFQVVAINAIGTSALSASSNTATAR